MLRAERAAMTTLIMSINRTFKHEIPVEILTYILESVILVTPTYGFDPVVFFQWFTTYETSPIVSERGDIYVRTTLDGRDGVEDDGTQKLDVSGIIYIAGSSITHRIMETRDWYPDDIDVFVDRSDDVEYVSDWFTRIFMRSARYIELIDTGLGYDNANIIKVQCGQFTLNVITGKNVDLMSFDAEMCMSYTRPPFTRVVESFDKNGPYRMWRVNYDQQRLDYELYKVLKQRAEKRERKYKSRFPALRLINDVDGTHSNVYGMPYDMVTKTSAFRQHSLAEASAMICLNM
jgi:hypothetical protein